jgi:prolyl oligopeptidase
VILRLIPAALALLATAAAAQGLPKFPAKDVPETFFGTVVHDPYRGLEDVKDPAVAAWMKAHADYAKSQLEGLKGYAALKARVAELDNAVQARIGSVQRPPSGELFFTRRGQKDNTFKLFVRAKDGKETLLADPDDWQKDTGKPHAINYFAASPDGKHVAFGVSAAGSEDASIYVIETATRKRVGKPIDRAQYPEINWRDDNSFFYLRQQKMEAGMPVTEKYQNNRSYLHVIGSDPEKDTLIIGPGTTPNVDVPRTDFPYVFAPRGSRYAILAIQAGVQREVTLYAAPLDTVGKPGTPWVKVCDPKDKVTDFAVMGDDIYLMTHRDSPKFSVVKTSLAKPDMAGAATVLPASKEVLFAVASARDALYVESRDGAIKNVKRLPWKSKSATVVSLPLQGGASLMTATPMLDGAILSLTAWTRAREIYAVDASGKATNTKLQPLGPFDAPADLVATEVNVRSHDGAMVPLSIIHKKSVKLDGSNPALLYAYGAYGITEEPLYGPTRLAWLERGGVYAVANVRGSGVHGEEWYKAGYKTTKPNTWKDLIACAEYLIAQKYTSSAKLGILGGSAGGITVGRALTERPDLFAAVIPAVGALDMVRAEATANGVPNIPEFGTVKKEDEFKALLAMSSYHNVKDRTNYPAVMLVAGANDPRVDVWHSSKMAARLMEASTSGKPVLLDLDYEGGHGIGDTKTQRQKQITDYYAFLLWQAGHPDFQPTGK